MGNKVRKFNFKIRAIKDCDREWIRKFISKEWASEKSVSRGKIYYPHQLPGFVAIKNKKYFGLIIYKIGKKDVEIITLNSIIKGKGLGKALVEKVKKIAKNLVCQRIWFITTNDNLDALIFWQKIGFVLKAVYPGAISLSRELKPEIPTIGKYSIPIRDEIELEFKIKK
jgi:GNAT superfamily N-acetyltransferase